MVRCGPISGIAAPVSIRARYQAPTRCSNVTPPPPVEYELADARLGTTRPTSAGCCTEGATSGGPDVRITSMWIWHERSSSLENTARAPDRPGAIGYASGVTTLLAPSNGRPGQRASMTSSERVRLLAYFRPGTQPIRQEGSRIYGSPFGMCTASARQPTSNLRLLRRSYQDQCIRSVTPNGQVLIWNEGECTELGPVGAENVIRVL